MSPKLQESRKTFRQADGRPPRTASSYSLTIPAAVVSAMAWEKGTPLDITATVHNGRPALLVREVKPPT